MHEMHKRKEILKNSCKGTQKATALGRKREWKVVSQLSISIMQSKAKRVQKCFKH